MNSTKVKLYKQVLRDIRNNYDGAGDFINERIEELRSQQKLYVEQVTVFSAYVFLLSFLTLK